MKKEDYELRIKELEDEIHVLKERYQILAETTPALLFEYKPGTDTMILTYNFPNNQSRREIQNYHAYTRKSPLVHPEHLQKFLGVLTSASLTATKGELEYLSKVSNGEFEWHKTYYSSIADKTGKVISVVGKISNIHASATERQKMIHKVETDYLTGLYNKGASTEKITQWLKNNPTKEGHLIMVDLDNFKSINDIYGHAFGDEILKETARIMVECFSENCLLSRFGGDEFIIFSHNEPLRQVESRVDSFMQKLVNEVTHMEQPLQCSVGISARASKSDDFENLFNRADNAMYLAKKNGKNRYFVYK